MLKATHTSELKGKIGESANETVWVNGFVHALRVQSKIIFLILRDVTGTVQVVIGAESPSFETAKNLSVESVVRIGGKVVEAKQAPGGVELQIESLEVLSVADANLAIPVVTIKGGEETEAPARFDHRWIDLRKPEKAKIFRVWTELERGFRKYWLENGYTQLYTPAFMNTPSESGAEVFEVKYFDRKAYLAQSPQFYKQMGMASGFERVFMTGPVFRAEESFTTRHLTEFTGWDFEISFIESHHDVMDEEEKLIISGFEAVMSAFPELRVQAPKSPFPRITMLEAKRVLGEMGVASSEDHDLSPEEERAICEYVKEKFDHEFVFIHEYHKSKSPFYHMLDPENNNRAKRADLLYRGLEITTLAQREHRLDVLEKQAIDGSMKTGVMDLGPLQNYFNFFKYGCPPHGGGGIGPGRLIMKILDLPNVREATYLPRDVKRLNP